MPCYPLLCFSNARLWYSACWSPLSVSQLVYLSCCKNSPRDHCCNSREQQSKIYQVPLVSMGLPAGVYTYYVGTTTYCFTVFVILRVRNDVQAPTPWQNRSFMGILQLCNHMTIYDGALSSLFD